MASAKTTRWLTLGANIGVLIGTNSGPDGTGNKVHFSGFEEWTIGEDGLIAQSDGNFDNDEYQYQLAHGVDF